MEASVVVAPHEIWGKMLSIFYLFSTHVTFPVLVMLQSIVCQEYRVLSPESCFFWSAIGNGQHTRTHDSVNGRIFL